MMAAEITPFAPIGWEDLDPYSRAASKRLPFINAAAWQDVPAPHQQWAVEHWLPQRQATYLTAPELAGKSLLGQQLCTS